MPHRGENKRNSTLRCTKTGGIQPKLNVACFVQSCLTDADFVIFSNYCLIGTRPIAVDFWETTWQSEKRVLPYETRLLLSLTNAVGAGRMRQAARELVKAYIHGVESAALDDVFELLAWNQGIGFFSSEIGPSALFQAYKLIKNGEKQGKSREDICSALREKFGEKNPEMQVLH